MVRPNSPRLRSPQVRIKKSEQGSSMAWTAIFLAAVLMPLMLFVIDGSRLFYVRGRLQTAADAACEDAAWAAGDRPNYIDTGETRLGNNWYVVSSGLKFMRVLSPVRWAKALA